MEPMVAAPKETTESFPVAMCMSREKVESMGIDYEALFSFECVCNKSPKQEIKRESKEAGARPTGIFAFQGPPTPKSIRRAKKSDQAGTRKKIKKRSQEPSLPRYSGILARYCCCSVRLLRPVLSASNPPAAFEYRKEKNLKEETRTARSRWRSEHLDPSRLVFAR